ncbi:uncharacterized protein LOC112005467 [Quercus suber]|uniref:Uncharacterized protein n=1 Tax=Quercus suber TaxID=58331 RepID=A0AAW0LVL9_QUESU|nr:uncharacterized protein LOC112005467 [Quercus suber]XP_023893484.1 uncharacterized protein LOC112005467 [Quercus suber]XP_023893485.1 uncharacterized protein LOC112005467 [Quercus suber]
MKLSLKFQENPNHQNQNPILKAKLPITIFNQPFISTTTTSTTTTTTTSSSDLSFSLSTNFPSGPSLKLSYFPTTTTVSSLFSLSLKSGLGLFGSPHNSPLVFSANFSLSPTNTPIPTFSLHFKPQLGHFSLKRSTFSDPSSNQVSGSFSNGGIEVNSGSYSNGVVSFDSGSFSNGKLGSGFVSDELSVWQELKLDPCSRKDGFTNPESLKNCGFDLNSGIGLVSERQLALKDSGKDGILHGVAVMARTVFPVAKRLTVNMRWGVNFPADLRKTMPYLRVNKIGIERVEEVKEVVKNSGENNVGDLELLKGMFFWMRKDLESLEKENREMKQGLEEMRLGISVKNFRGESDVIGKKVVPPTSESSSEFERWRSKKSGGEENGQRESKKSTNRVSDVESELQRAIKAASL